MSGLNPLFIRSSSATRSRLTRRLPPSRRKVSIPYSSGLVVQPFGYGSDISGNAVSGLNPLFIRSSSATHSSDCFGIKIFETVEVSIPYSSGLVVQLFLPLRPRRVMSVSIPYSSGLVVQLPRQMMGLMLSITRLNPLFIRSSSATMTNLNRALIVSMSQSLIHQG